MVKGRGSGGMIAQRLRSTAGQATAMTMRKTSITYPNGAQTTYVYDNNNRLTQLTNNGTSDVYTYTYDAAGNRTSENVTEASITTATSYTYNAQNRMISVTQNGATVSYAYDYNGNMISKGSETYSYDALDRMIYAAGATYAYNGEGKRVSKTANGATTWYLYEGDQVILEKDSGGNIIRNVHGANLISWSIVQKQSTTISEKHMMEIRYDNTAFYQYNGRGDVTRLSDFNGNSEEYTYDAFGNQLSKTTNGEVGKNPFRYAGYMYDEESELYYLNARYYDPKTARFTSEDDPSYGNLNDPLSLNLYTYCHNEPIMHVDPNGHIPASLDENGNSTVPGWLDWDGDGYVDTKEDKARFDKDGDRIADWNQGKGEKKDYRPGGKYSANPSAAEETDRLPRATNRITDRYGTGKMFRKWEKINASGGANYHGDSSEYDEGAIFSGAELEWMKRNNPAMYEIVMASGTIQLPLDYDDVSVLLRPLVEMYGGKIQCYSDRVVVILRGKQQTYYYDVKKRKSVHGNYMVKNRMYVNAVEFGKYFGLTKSHTNSSTRVYPFVVTETEKDWSQKYSGTQKVMWGFTLGYLRVPGKVIIYHQSYSVASYGWTQPQLNAPELFVFPQVKYYNQNGELIRTVELRKSEKKDTLERKDINYSYSFESGHSQNLVFERNGLITAQVSYLITKSGSSVNTPGYSQTIQTTF